MRVSFLDKIKLSVLGLVFLVTLFSIYFSYSYAPKSYLQVNYLNVGQGDATLFVTPRGGKILIDGGRDKKVLSELGRTLPVGDKNIELVIATHDDSDHITGLIDVIKKYNVKVLLYSLPESESELSKNLIKIAEEKNVQVIKISKPMIVRTDDGLIIKILFPVSNMSGIENGNDASIVTQFIFGENKFLLTGDLSIFGEKFLVNKYGESLQSNILKLGHHGSDTSTGPEFLQKVSPDVAIVSAGENNSFGHPHRSVVELVEKFGIKIYQTKTEGNITFRSNGLNIWRE